MASQRKDRDVAKKVIVTVTKWYACPCCKSSKDGDVFTDTGDSYEDYPLRRCQNCGQLLDWSETEYSEWYAADKTQKDVTK